jgi:NAD-dependent DNA ligase
MDNMDEQQYRVFTAKQEADKAMHSLKGILLGINMDMEINDREILELNKWVSEHKQLVRRYPFKEFLDMIENITSHDIPTKEIVEDMWWLSQKYESANYYYDTVTTDLQTLQGICHGILSDGIINDKEIIGLNKWLKRHKHLRKHYPYDEISTLLLDVLSDKKIDDDERKLLMAYFAQFSKIEDEALKEKIAEEIKDVPISGLCSTGVKVVFKQKQFCVTGILKRSPRNVLHNDISNLGGIPVDTVTERTDYLIVGDNGNQAWSFACYGRKVEKAMELRKKGHKISIIHEFDFGDIIDDLK